MTTPMAYVVAAARVEQVKHSSTTSDETSLPSARKPRQRKISLSDLPEIGHTLISKIDLYQPQKETIIRTRTAILRLLMDLEVVFKRYAAVRTTYRRKIASLRKLIKERYDEYDQALLEVQQRVQENTIGGIDNDHQSDEPHHSTSTEAQTQWHEEDDLEQQVTCLSTANDQLQPKQIADSGMIVDKLRKMRVGVRTPAPQSLPNRTAAQESEKVPEVKSLPRSRRNHIDHRNVVCFKCNKKGHYARECRSQPGKTAG